MTRLVEARDDDFGWMLGGAPGGHGLCLPPGGVDQPATLTILRDAARAIYAGHDRGAWMIVEGNEVVGLCGYRAAPDADGAVEIGYGVAESRRNLGHATRAVEEMIAVAVSDPAARIMLAVTLADNPVSQRCLIRNGFAEEARGFDEVEGHVVLWRHNLG